MGTAKGPQRPGSRELLRGRSGPETALSPTLRPLSQHRLPCGCHGRACSCCGAAEEPGWFPAGQRGCGAGGAEGCWAARPQPGGHGGGFKKKKKKEEKDHLALRSRPRVGFFIFDAGCKASYRPQRARGEHARVPPARCCRGRGPEPPAPGGGGGGPRPPTRPWGLHRASSSGGLTGVRGRCPLSPGPGCVGMVPGGGCAAPAIAESSCSPSPRPPDPPGLAAARVGHVGKQRKAAGAALTMVPMLYVAAGPMVWWYGSAAAYTLP